MLTKPAVVWYHVKSVRTADSFHHGEMSERLKEPVLKTGDVQASVGSNPTLSATFFKFICHLQKYPRGRRGSPAKGVGWIKPARGFKSLLLRHVGAKFALLRRSFFLQLTEHTDIPETIKGWLPGYFCYIRFIPCPLRCLAPRAYPRQKSRAAFRVPPSSPRHSRRSWISCARGARLWCPP